MAQLPLQLSPLLLSAGGRLSMSPYSVAIALLFTIVFSWCLPTLSLAQTYLRLDAYDAGVFDPDQGPLITSYQLLKDADELEILIEDFQGKVVDRYVVVDLLSGKHHFSWNGLDDQQKRYPDGRYSFIFTARFADGTQEKSRAEARLATLAAPTGEKAPSLFPPQEKIYEIDGSISSFWRRNSEDPSDKDDEGEQRLRTHVNIRTEKHYADGVFAVRKPYSEKVSYNGSQVLLEQRWNSGKAKEIFRQSLGNFDDPMKLFNDFRTERNKVGIRLEQKHQWLALTALALNAEGDTASEEKAGGGRIVFGPDKGWKIGSSVVIRNAVQFETNEPSSSHAAAWDFRLPLGSKLALISEYATTESPDGVDDSGHVLKSEYIHQQCRITGGYFFLGENFSAEYADPLRQVYQDAKGVDLNVDYRRRSPLWKLSNLSLSLRGYTLTKESNHNKIKEGDSSVRFNLGHNDTILLSWFGRNDDGDDSKNILFSDRHRWNEEWSSNLQLNNNSTETSRTWRSTVDTDFRQNSQSYRFSLEYIHRKTFNSANPSESETTFGFNMGDGPLQLELKARHSRKQSKTGTNFFSRADYSHDFLHRYQLNFYLSLGDRATFNTEEQVEIGMEMRF